MTKTQWQLALAACGMSLVAAAQADTMIYGRIHADIESTVSGARGARATTRVQNNASRVGFKGTEDLGDGLSAIWQVESGVAIDDGSSGGSNQWAGRESFVGLSSKTLGTLKLGSFLVPLDDLHGIAGNMFQYVSGISNDAALWLNGGNLATGGFDIRGANSISYQTPEINGFTSRIQHSLTSGAGGAESTSHGGATVTSGDIVYKSGPLSVAYGIQANRSMSRTSSGFYDNALANMLVAGYSFGDLYLAGLIEHDTMENINRSGDRRNRNYASLTASYTLGRNVFTVLGGKAGSWTGDAGVDNSGATMGTVAYNHVLSKTTQVYVLYTALRNDSNGTYVLGGSPALTPQARNQHSLALGMWKNF
ncbi:porin [Microvirgula aerodenitrificans]|uniref:Porin n=1 Tax=Microvirgula aerodenitrificans TaxID=57480 RepID=A0A2S0PE17_9NEIS|nr:porin [Microvirgula aerodenitrificans]AVY95507.1 porin [Microvirgula aerodenitrificans]